jgi:hypothetical protein
MGHENSTHLPDIPRQCGPDDDPPTQIAGDELTGDLHQPGLGDSPRAINVDSRNWVIEHDAHLSDLGVG